MIIIGFLAETLAIFFISDAFGYIPKTKHKPQIEEAEDDYYEADDWRNSYKEQRKKNEADPNYRTRHVDQ